MEILVNDLSIHEQFFDLDSFQESIERLMVMREAARRFSQEIYCSESLRSCEPVKSVPIQKAVASFPLDRQRSLMSWLTRYGPFWDELRQHGSDDWIECKGLVVTDTAIGEAAYRTLHSLETDLVSLTPSDWEDTPIEVRWFLSHEDSDVLHTRLNNWTDVQELETRLRSSPPPIHSWQDLNIKVRARFPSIRFGEEWITPLRGHPFSKSASDRFLSLLGVLDSLIQAYDRHGNRTTDGHRVYRDYFTGERAWFSDSSDSEKRRFREELTFRDPNEPGTSLFCPWHGKVSHGTLRLHYSWTGIAGDPAFVVYAGPKITKL